MNLYKVSNTLYEREYVRACLWPEAIVGHGDEAMAIVCVHSAVDRRKPA